MPPRVDRASTTPPERRALQDALAWPIAATLLVGAGLVFFLPRFFPPRFVPLAVGGVFAIVTVSLVAILAFVVERWLVRHAATMAQNAENQVQTLGVAGLPAATGDSALIPLASAFADAGARAALRAAERESNDMLGQLGDGAAAATDRAVSAIRATLDDTARTPADALGAVRSQLHEIERASAALRQVTASVPAPADAIDLVAELRTIAAELSTADETSAVNASFDTDRGMVRIDRQRFTAHLRDLIALARAASNGTGSVAVHVSRVFRSNIEETPVRRTGDSRLTIVPRSSGDSLRAWVLRAQPGAEVLSIVITDAGTAPEGDALTRAFDPFTIARPGDPLGISLATVRRTVAAARGTIWIDGSREGGTAVHLLLPIAVS